MPTEPIRVELTWESGELWTWGPADAANRVTGPALDFCLLVTQRRNRADTAVEATGEVADSWLDIAQAFAGPPGRLASQPNPVSMSGLSRFLALGGEEKHPGETAPICRFATIKVAKYDSFDLRSDRSVYLAR